MLDKKIGYFITVVEEGSFSKAAKRLFLSQPNLSKQVSLLEAELEVQLLDRNGYRPTLTKEGEVFYREITGIQTQCCQLKEQLRNMKNRHIAIGFSGAFENREILKVINAFKKQHPTIDVSFLNDNFQESVKNLLNENIDISFGLESTYRHFENIQYDVLYSYDICLVCSFDHPWASLDSIDVAQMKNEKMILLSKKYGTDFYKDFMDACKKDGLKPRISKEVDSMDELIFEVSTGNGVSIVSREVVRDSEVKVLNIQNTHHASKYVIAYLKGEKSPAISAFIQCVNAYFKNHNSRA